MIRRQYGFSLFLFVSALTLLLAQAPVASEERTALKEGKFGRLEQDRIWSGTIVLNGDLHIPSGRTLVVQAGSTITPTPRQSLWDLSVSRNLRGAVRAVTHSGLIDIIVEGTLRFEGTWLSRISVADLKEGRPSSWGGIVIINKGKLETRYASIYLADTALIALDKSEANILNTTFKFNLAGVEAFHQSSLVIKDSTLSANPTGVSLYDESEGRIENNWFRFNTSAILIADQSKALVRSNIFFKNILAISSLDSTRPQIKGNYLIANQTGIRLGQRATPEIEGNWSLFEKKRVADERDQPSKPLK